MVRGVFRQVRVYPLSDFAEETPEFGRRSEVASFGRFAVRLFIRLARLFAAILCLSVRGERRIEAGARLRDSRLPLVQLRVQRSDLA